MGRSHRKSQLKSAMYSVDKRYFFQGLKQCAKLNYPSLSTSVLLLQLCTCAIIYEVMHYKFVCHSSSTSQASVKSRQKAAFACLLLPSSSRTEYIVDFNCDLRCDHPMVFYVIYKKRRLKKTQKRPNFTYLQSKRSTYYFTSLSFFMSKIRLTKKFQL